MFSPKNRCFTLTILVLSMLSFNKINAQENGEYFRYYELKLKPSADLNKTFLSDKINESPFRFHSTCPINHSIVVSVSANYPKRIDAIKNELHQQFKKELSKADGEKIKVIKASDLQSYCQ